MGVYTVKKTLLWTAVLFLLTSFAVPTAVLADGNPRCGGGTCNGGSGQSGGGH